MVAGIVDGIVAVHTGRVSRAVGEADGASGEAMGAVPHAVSAPSHRPATITLAYSMEKRPLNPSAMTGSTHPARVHPFPVLNETNQVLSLFRSAN